MLLSFIVSFDLALQKKQLNTLSLLQEIGYTHMRIAEGVQSLLQMSALLARLCKKSAVPGIKG